MPEATRAAAEIESVTGTAPELIPGESGVFDVVRDGERLYAKSETGRFPKPGELAELFNA